MALHEGEELLYECKSGWLTVEEDFSARLSKPEQLQYALQCMSRNPSSKAVQRYWTQCGGSMSFDQFCVVMRREKKSTLKDLMAAFKRIDTNGDGYITTDELYRMLTKRGEKMSYDEVRSIIDEADANRDGRLDYEEFCHMLLSTAEDCTKASNNKASKFLGKKHSLTDGSRHTGQGRSLTGLTGRERRRGQRGEAFDRRERRREEIRNQLHSASEGQLRGKRGREGGRDNWQDFSETAIAQPPDHDPSLSTPKFPDQIPLNYTQLDDAPQARGEGLVNGQAEDLTSLESESRETVRVVEGEGDEAAKGRVSWTNDHPPSPATSPTADLVDADSNELLREKTGRNKDAIEHPKDWTGQSDPKSQEQIDGLGLTQRQGTPLTSKALPPSKLPPLKPKGALPPIPPSVSLTTPLGDHSRREEETSEEEEVAEELEEEKEEGEGASPTQETIISAPSPPMATEMNPTTSGIQLSESQNVVADELPPDHPKPTTNGPPTPPSGTKGPPPSEPRPPSATREQPTSSPEAANGEGKNGERRKIEESELGGRQPDHLPTLGFPTGGEGGGGGREVVMGSPSSVVPASPKRPEDLESWNSITGKGCFYLDVEEDADDSTIKCHQYRLNLTAPTHVWIEVGVASPGRPATDVLLFVFHCDENEEPTNLITYTQHKVDQHWVCRLDLDSGCYALIPFTSGCHLRPREEEHGTGAVPLVAQEGGKVVLTEPCRSALEEVFNRIDLDSNGFISRTEFDFFQERASGEICDDDAWRVIQDNFELTADDELTLKGFLDLHVMTAEDEEGGEEEVSDVLSSLGYNKQLQLDQACPFELEVFTEECEGEIEIIDIFTFAPVIDPALCQLAVERGLCQEVQDGRGELFTHTFSTPHMTTIVLENKGSKKSSVQLDCSRSTNMAFSRESSVHVMEVKAHSMVVGFHLMPQDPSTPHTTHCTSSRILC